VADEVKAAVINGSAAVALLAYEGQAENAAGAALDQATAASAVVLASDLRAPGTPETAACEMADQVGWTMLAMPSEFAERLIGQKISADAVAHFSGYLASLAHIAGAYGHVPNVPSVRERLANVERLLLEVDRGFVPGVSAPAWNRATAALIEAFHEVRAIMGEGE
jgi:hypothetical protein